MPGAIKINQAVKDVREALASGMTFTDAIAQAAEIFDLNPVLVARKFQEQYGLSPERVAALGPLKVVSKESQFKQAIDDATAKYGRHPMRGKKFKHDFKDWIFIAFVEGEKHPVVAIEVESQQVWLMAPGYMSFIERSRL